MQTTTITADGAKPTVDEAGVPGYEPTSRFTVAAPAKVARPIMSTRNAHLNAMLATREAQAHFEELGIRCVRGSPEDAGKHFARETDKWSRVIEAAGIRAH